MKLILEAVHQTTDLHVPEISIAVSLIVIVSVLAVTTIASLLYVRRHPGAVAAGSQELRTQSLRRESEGWSTWTTNRPISTGITDPFGSFRRVAPLGVSPYVALLAWGVRSMGGPMATVARVTEISATSTKSFEDAVAIGVERANSTLRNVTSAWIKEQSVVVKDGAITGYQVNMLVTFVLDD